MGQAKSGYSVNNTEISGFGISPLVFGDFFYRQTVYFRSRSRVDILTGTECRKHVFVLAEMRHEPQLDLAVIGGEEQTSLIGNNRFADEPPALGAYRQVLQIRIAAGEPPRSRHSLVIRCMDLTVFGINISRQSRDIGGDQFFQFPLLQDQPHNLMFVAQSG